MKFELNSKIDLITRDDEIVQGLIHDIRESKLLVAIPPEDKSFKILRVGDEVFSIVYQPLKLIGFEARISARLNEDVPLYQLSDLKNFSKVQRRQDVRVESSIPVEFSSDESILDCSERDLPAVYERNKGRFEGGLVVNLSAGGMKFSCSRDYKTQQRIALHFVLDGESFIVKGVIVYKEIRNLPSKHAYTYGVKFLNLDEFIKDKIIKYNFKQMRKNRLR